MRQQQTFSKYLFLTCFILIALLSLFILKPFLNAVLAGVLLAYIFYPVYTMLHERIRSENASALLATLIILLIVSIPFLAIISAVSKDVKKVYRETKEKIAKQGIFRELPGPCEGSACLLKKKIDAIITNPEFITRVQAALGKISAALLAYTSDLVLFLPRVLIKLFITFFVIFYGFRDGGQWMRRFYDLLPFQESFKRDLRKQTGEVIYATVYGVIIVGLIQGFIATIGYFIFGIHSPLLLGALTALAAILPFVGAAIIWLPVGLVQVINGFDLGNETIVWKGIGLLTYGLILVSTIDNVLKPKIIGHRSNVHPALILIGLLGGLVALGPIGILIGPLALATLVSFIRVYEKDRKILIG